MLWSETYSEEVDLSPLWEANFEDLPGLQTVQNKTKKGEMKEVKKKEVEAEAAVFAAPLAVTVAVQVPVGAVLVLTVCQGKVTETGKDIINIRCTVMRRKKRVQLNQWRS